MFNLPLSSKVNKSIPKKSFDSYINAKQKKYFTDTVNKIRWINKLSSQTINLQGIEVGEIEVFEIELKQKENLVSILEIIDKSIPYPIIFIVRLEDEIMLSIAKKHIHPTNENNAVVDFRFNTDWLKPDDFYYELNLRKNLDFVLFDICVQITDRKQKEDQTIQDLVDREQKIKQLTFKIDRVKGAIKTCMQFNKKVDLNLELKALEVELKSV